jgi:hypothetical protein
MIGVLAEVRGDSMPAEVQNIDASTKLPRRRGQQPYAAGLALAMLCAAPVFAQSNVAADEIRAQIEALRAEQSRIGEAQQQTDAKLHALEAQLSAASAPSTAATAPPPSPPLTADAKPHLKISGDVRLRSQGDYSDDDARSRNSAQVRARFGATYTVSDKVTLGARVVTGDPDDPNSTDVQLSNFADDLQMGLDLAYAQVNLGDLKLYGGKIPQPFTRTDLVWDGDVNPQGVSAVYKHPFANGSAVRVNSLFFVVDEQAVATDTTMVGAQLGYDSPALGDWKYDVSAAYYDYRLGNTAGADAGDFRSNMRNPDGSYRSDFDLGDIIVGATWSGAGERWPVRVVGDYVHNFKAATSADTGYGVDVALGRASRAGDWRLTYGYSVAQTDAVLAAFSHDNIGIATNYKLHALTLDYVPLPKTMLTAIWYRYKPDNAIDAGSNAVGDWLDRIRVAFLVSF